MCEVVVRLFPAYRLQLLKHRGFFFTSQNTKKNFRETPISLHQFDPLPLSAHHVVPEGNSHLSMCPLTDVEAVHREETSVWLTHLVKRFDFQQGYI